MSLLDRILRDARLRRVPGLEQLTAHPGVQAGTKWWADALGRADGGPPYGTWPQLAVENGLIHGSITPADLDTRFLVPDPAARARFGELALEAIAKAARAGMIERVEHGAKTRFHLELSTDPLGQDAVLTHCLHLAGLSWLTLPYAVHMTVTADHTVVHTLAGRRIVWSRR